MKTKITMIAIACLFTVVASAQSNKVLRIHSGDLILKEYKGREFTAVEIQDSETVKGEINGYEYVDLGLPSGLKWATCNVGAASPEEYGDYFHWGETTTKEEYREENCSTYGVNVGVADITGMPEYDAAAANWGGTWRIPTYDECRELFDFGEWEDSTYNGVAGMKVTGPNGNYIFLPYNGSMYGTSHTSSPGAGGYFWSGKATSDKNGYKVGFAVRHQGFSMCARYYANGVRPVSN